MAYKKNKVSDNGLSHMAASTLAIAGLARDCAHKLSGNIQLINQLRTYFKSSVVVVVENGSRDKTRHLLDAWAKSESNVHILEGNPLIPTTLSQPAIVPNLFYSLARIQKLASLRNQYITYLAGKNIQPDYFLVLDFDVDQISLDGVLHSFERQAEWEVISAYGYSRSPFLQERYHDSFALVPLGEENHPKTEKSIKSLQPRFRLSTKSTQLVPVHAAYGGLCIYKTSGKALPLYKALPTGDSRVEAKCEHIQFSEHFTSGQSSRAFINPKMHLRYQTIWEAVSRRVSK
jgi:hypothetical protein